MAYVSGGAIAVQGPAVSTLQVEESVFDTNALRIPMDGSGVDVTVRLNTGFTAGHLPIWRIDDGPVYGIPWELCQLALEYSMDAVSKGLQPSWPNMQCANVSYGSGSTRAAFNHVLSLTQGSHRLWTGILTNVRCPNGKLSMCL